MIFFLELITICTKFYQKKDKTICKQFDYKDFDLLMAHSWAWVFDKTCLLRIWLLFNKKQSDYFTISWTVLRKL